MKRIVAVRVRGTPKARKSIKDTLTMLNLTKPHHAVVVDDRPTYAGMLDKVKDYVTYGEIDQSVLEMLLRKWARLEGNHRVTEEYVKGKTGQTIKEFTSSVMNFEKELDELEIKKVFRLHPPRKGYKSIKRAFSQSGSLGYRGSDINALVRRMI
ncbi:MAG: 50S ribosomal protein L30 [Theionarchaea archaeon]|nr:MAG: 50S ribosomal protein L30 [Theionarchaea archaeon DG-70-1]MBU7026869.1 50S ribosomal protein L30 [Theionarchaea archaeon]